MIFIVGLSILLSACNNINSENSNISNTIASNEGSVWEGPVNKADIHLTYSNLADEGSRNRAKNALSSAGVKEEDINKFFEAVGEYNNAVGLGNLTDSMTSINEAFPNYDSDKLIDLWLDNGGFVGRNCRITSYSLMKDFINVGNPVIGDTTMLFSDFEGIDAKNIYNDAEVKDFKSIFSYIDVTKTMDVDIIAKEIKKDFENKQITFNNDKMHMISVFMTLDDGTGKVQEFIGHTGVLLNDGDKYLFIEKLAFQLPYQLVEFNNKQEVNDYLMGYYDNDTSGLIPKPVIFEDDHIMKEYRAIK